MKKKVVVTGMGAITPVGLNVQDFWYSLTCGISGVDFIQSFDAENFPTTFGAEIKNFSLDNILPKKDMKRMDSFTQFGIAAAKEALQQANINFENVDPYRVGVIVGSGAGGSQFILDNHLKMIDRGPKKISPYLSSGMLINAVSSEIAMLIGAKGKSGAFVTACATGSNCIGEGMRSIQWGEADIMIVGGTEGNFSALDLAGFSIIRALSTYNDDPKLASRPFDRTRDGFVLGAGAGILVLESEEFALKRGASIIAELKGYGFSTDAYHYTAPDPECKGMSMSMIKALEEANFSPSEIHYINAHGTSTKLNDYYETLAIKKVFGLEAKNIPVSSNKSMIGHLLGGAGAVELIASICSIQNDIAPPTINYHEKESELDLNYVPNEAQSCSIQNVLSNSFGFGGHNVTLIVSKWEK